ncbi:hypothetical protein OSI96_26590, partial [Mycobacterium ulcerans]
EDEAGAVAAIDVPSSRDVDELEVARELVRQAREAGVGLTGPGAPTRGRLLTHQHRDYCERQ